VTVLDRLPLGPGHALVVRGDGARPRPEPWLSAQDRRAQPGEGAAEALVALLAAGSQQIGRFRITVWEGASLTGERTFGVDQTNESVIVGERAVVKWMRVAEPGPHPAPPMLSALMEHEFTGIPRPWGLVEWQGEGDAAPRLLATIDTLVPDAVDGWTWAVDDVRAAVTAGDHDVVIESGARVGTLIAEMHAALADTGRPATDADVEAWTTGALDDLYRALDTSTGRARELLVERTAEMRARVVPPRLVGTPLILVHGDLHVGQLLRSPDVLVVTDFDGNPVVPPGQRTTPQPAALDVAGMAQSLSHAAYVLRRYEPEYPAPVVRAASDAFVGSFLHRYAEQLAELGATRLYAPELVPGLRLRQVCREFTYAGLHLPRWSYVPEAAIVDLLDPTDPETP